MKKIVFMFVFLSAVFFIFSGYAKSFAAANGPRTTEKGTLALIWNQDCEKAKGQCVVNAFYEKEKANLDPITGVECKGETSGKDKNGNDIPKISQDESNRFICVKSKADKKLCNRCSNTEGCTRTSFYIDNKDNNGVCDDKAQPTLDSSGKAYKESVGDMTCKPIPNGTKEANKNCKDSTQCPGGGSCVKTFDAKTQTKTGSCFITEGTTKVVASCVKPKTGSGNANNNDKNNTSACKAKNGMCLDSCNATYPSFVSSVNDCPVANQVCCAKTTDQSRAQQAAQQGTNTQCRCQPATVACQGRNMGMGNCGANMINCCTTTSNDPMSQLAQSLGNLLNKIINPSSAPRSNTSTFPTSTPFISMTPTPTPTSDSLNNPNGVDATFNLKINFHGITKLNGSSSNLKVKVTLVDSLATTTTKTAVQESNFTSAGAGVFTGSVTFAKVVPKKGYYLLIKGPKHVQRKICSTSPSENYPGEYKCNDLLTVSSGVNDIDASRIYMLAGDVPKQDGIVNSADFGNVKTRFGKSDYASLEVADLNLDGVVNSQDFSLVIQTLQTTGGVDQK